MLGKLLLPTCRYESFGIMYFNVLKKRNRRIHKQMNRQWQFLLYVYITFYSSSLDVICKLWCSDTFSSRWKGLSENATSFMHHFGSDSYPSQPLLIPPAALHLIVLMVWNTACCSCSFSSSVGIYVTVRTTCLLLPAGDRLTDLCFLGYSKWPMLASQTSDCHISCLTKDSKSFLAISLGTARAGMLHRGVQAGSEHSHSPLQPHDTQLGWAAPKKANNISVTIRWMESNESGPRWAQDIQPGGPGLSWNGAHGPLGRNQGRLGRAGKAYWCPWSPDDAFFLC